jgi:hypothetical protein
MTSRAECTSARLTSDEKSAPATKPSCTAIVSQAPAVVPRSHSTRSCGSTADAENQVDIESTSASASRPSDLPAPAFVPARPTGGGATSSGP